MTAPSSTTTRSPGPPVHRSFGLRRHLGGPFAHHGCGLIRPLHLPSETLRWRRIGREHVGSPAVAGKSEPSVPPDPSDGAGEFDLDQSARATLRSASSRSTGRRRRGNAAAAGPVRPSHVRVRRGPGRQGRARTDAAHRRPWRARRQWLLERCISTSPLVSALSGIEAHRLRGPLRRATRHTAGARVSAATSATISGARAGSFTRASAARCGSRGPRGERWSRTRGCPRAGTEHARRS